MCVWGGVCARARARVCVCVWVCVWVCFHTYVCVYDERDIVPRGVRGEGEVQIGWLNYWFGKLRTCNTIKL